MSTRVTAFGGPLRLTRSSLFFTLQPEPPAATSSLTGVAMHPDPHRIDQAERPSIYSLLCKHRAKENERQHERGNASSAARNRSATLSARLVIMEPGSDVRRPPTYEATHPYHRGHSPFSSFAPSLGLDFLEIQTIRVSKSGAARDQGSATDERSTTGRARWSTFVFPLALFPWSSIPHPQPWQ